MTFQTRFKLQRYFDSINENIDIDSLDSRITFQKKVYFMQTLGLDINYYFSWYLHGPYSTSLADDSYALNSMQLAARKKIASKIRTDADMEILMKLKELLTLLEQASPHMEENERLELAASLHFLAQRTYGGDYKKRKVIERLKYHKSDFKQKDIEVIWKLLQSYNLL